MSLKNINSSPRFTQHLVASRAFKRKPLTVVDVGARGGFDSSWLFYGDQVKLIGFEADREECKRQNQAASDSRRRVFPYALYQKRGKKPFMLRHILLLQVFIQQI